MDLLGGFPMHEGESWDVTRLNKSKLFEDYPQLMQELLRTGFTAAYHNKNHLLHYVVVSCLKSFLLKFVI